jgi:hypothetical protein
MTANRSTNKSTSTILVYLEATIKSPELHRDAEPMKAFYKALGAAVESVKSSVPNAESDRAFKKAADIISSLAPQCKKMEKMRPTMAAKQMQNWIQDMSDIGVDGIMDVEGEASKMLAEKFIVLLQKLIDKKYWPIATTPRLSTEYLPAGFPEFGPSFATVYAINYRDRNKSKLEQTIAATQQRIDAYIIRSVPVELKDSQDREDRPAFKK